MTRLVRWSPVLREGLVSGAVASVVSSVILVACGKAERGDPSRPLNGPSQWVWGRHAPFVQGFSVKHTVVGYAIHHAASMFWALLFARLRPRRDRNNFPDVVAASALITTIAYIADFKLVPTRVSPGFQRQLTKRCLYAAYAGFAFGLVIGALGSSERGRE